MNWRPTWKETRESPTPCAASSRHPDLRPWADLSESDREKDRAAIRAIPVILADFGLHVVPLDDDAGWEAADAPVPDPRGVVRGWRMFGRGRSEPAGEG